MSTEDRLLEILGSWREHQSRGEAIDPEAVLEAHPDLAEELRACFATLKALDEVIGEEGSAPGSVLARLSEGGEPWRPVVLRDPDERDATAPVVRAGSAGAHGVEGRYQVVGEIARGGVGVVLKGLDLDLGRSVAMKVVLEEHRANQDIIQRFVEEAQIGGQLQHPGIVPVYEIGLRKDRRPYFTMKLVKGRTLSALLSERGDVAEDRQRFLSIFESVCQTVAYAHARGVVHRDLKPANIMVGAFGEVLVVDWGMGKVLRQGGVDDERKSRDRADRTVVQTVRSESVGSASVAGSVLGTLRYMPPEQARGDLVRVDERSDVFALGATLCEILTGSPPYAGATQQELFRQAADARLDDAYERLARSGADEELVLMAKRCLSPAREARPKDAGELAREVRAYLSAVEERARRARIEAAEANARAAREEARAARERAAAERARHARRLTLILSAAAVLLIGLATGAWLWIDGQRRERERETARLVARDLEDAAALRGQAETTDAIAAWTRALAAARRAGETARRRDAGEELLARASALEEGLAAELAAAEERAAERARDEAMAVRLDELRQRAGSQRDPEKWAPEAYAAAFAEYGIDLDGLEPDQAAERVRASKIRDRLLVGLNAWRYLQVLNLQEPEVQRLDAVLDRADDDPWRKRLRQADGLEALQRLREEADLEALPLETLLQLALGLASRGDPESAARIAIEAQQRHPGDYWVNFYAGRFLSWSERHRPQWAEAARYETVALSLRPDSIQAHINLGCSLTYVPGHLEEAIAVLRRGLESGPDKRAYCNLAMALSESGDNAGAIAAAREAVRLDPDMAVAHLSLIGLLKGQVKGQGEHAGAIEACREALRRFQEPDVRAVLLRDLATSLQATGDEPGAVAAAEEIVRLFDGGRRVSPDSLADTNFNVLGQRVTPQAFLWYTLASAHWLRRDMIGVVEACRKALTWSPDFAQVLFMLGYASSRTGDLRYAVAAYSECVRVEPGEALAWCNLGLCARRLGWIEQAVHALRRGHELGSAQPDWSLPSADWLAEAERLLALQRRVWGLAAGAGVPLTPKECFDLGLLAFGRNLPVAAAAFRAKAFGEDPSLAEERGSTWPRYEAACFAALASAGDGEDARDLSPSERARWRAQALAWLEAELAFNKAAVEEDAAGVVGRLEYWGVDPDLAAIRDEEKVGSLPEEEREALSAFWAEVDALLQRARDRVKGD